MLFMSETLHPVLLQLAQHKIVPVIALEDAANADPLAQALMAGKLPVAEVTFRTAAAQASIKAMSAHKDMIVGAGTVLSPTQVDQAIDAGAKYIVAPGLNPKVVEHCIKRGIPITPGAVTPTEIEMALDLGLKIVKFFPAGEYGGLKTIKALSAPYGMMKFIPTGGISAANLAEYLSFKAIHAVGGSWMVSKELLAAKNWSEVTRLAAEATTIASGVKA